MTPNDESPSDPYASTPFDVTVNLVMMLVVGAFFFVFPVLFVKPWPPRFTVDAVMLVGIGQAVGLAGALWSRYQAARGGSLGRRLLRALCGSFLAAVVLILLAHTILVLFFYDPANPRSDLILMRMLLFGPFLVTALSPIVVYLYEKRHVSH